MPRWKLLSDPVNTDCMHRWPIVSTWINITKGMPCWELLPTGNHNDMFIWKLLSSWVKHVNRMPRGKLLLNHGDHFDMLQ